MNKKIGVFVLLLSLLLVFSGCDLLGDLGIGDTSDDGTTDGDTDAGSDAYEANDTKQTAFDLTPNNETGTITLSQIDGNARLSTDDMVDWYTFNAPEIENDSYYFESFIKITITSTSAITFSVYDETSNTPIAGGDEATSPDFLGTGVFYIKVEGNGTYDLELLLSDVDSQHTNNSMATAEEVDGNWSYSSSIGTPTTLWYSFQIAASKHVEITLTYDDVSESRSIGLYDSAGALIYSISADQGIDLVINRNLDAGQYYVKADMSYNYDMLIAFTVDITFSDDLVVFSQADFKGNWDIEISGNNGLTASGLYDTSGTRISGDSTAPETFTVNEFGRVAAVAYASMYTTDTRYELDGFLNADKDYMYGLCYYYVGQYFIETLDWTATKIDSGPDDDSYEPNSSEAAAYGLNTGTQTGDVTLSDMNGKGQLIGTDDEDWYSFSLPSTEMEYGVYGAMYSVQFDITEGSCAWFLYDSNSTEMNNGDDVDGYDGDIGEGQYYIKIIPDAVATAQYDFDLSITPVLDDDLNNHSKDTAVALTDGTDVTGFVSPVEAGSQWFSLVLGEELAVDITCMQTAVENIEFDGSLTLYDDLDQVIETATKAGDSITISTTLTAGTYYIEADLAQNGDILEPYSIGYSSGAAATLSVSASPTSFTIWLSDSSSYEEYTSFTLTNTGTGVDYSISHDFSSAYIDISPGSGSIAEGGSETINLMVSAFSDEPGTITVDISNAAGSDIITIPMDLYIDSSSY